MFALHRKVSSVARNISISMPQASCCNNARICCCVTPRISTRFVLLLSPLRILTATSAFSKAAPETQSALHLHGLPRRGLQPTFNAPAISPAISSLLARGCTVTTKQSLRLVRGYPAYSAGRRYGVFRSPKSAVPTRTSVAPSSMAHSKIMRHAHGEHRQSKLSFFHTSSRNFLKRRKYGRTSSAFSRNGGMHISPATSRCGKPLVFSARVRRSLISTPVFVSSGATRTSISTRNLPMMPASPRARSKRCATPKSSTSQRVKQPRRPRGFIALQVPNQMPGRRQSFCSGERDSRGLPKRACGTLARIVCSEWDGSGRNRRIGGDLAFDWALASNKTARAARLFHSVDSVDDFEWRSVWTGPRGGGHHRQVARTDRGARCAGRDEDRRGD